MVSLLLLVFCFLFGGFSGPAELECLMSNLSGGGVDEQMSDVLYMSSCFE